MCQELFETESINISLKLLFGYMLKLLDLNPKKKNQPPKLTLFDLSFVLLVSKNIPTFFRLCFIPWELARGDIPQKIGGGFQGLLSFHCTTGF